MKNNTCNSLLWALIATFVFPAISLAQDPVNPENPENTAIETEAQPVIENVEVPVDEIVIVDAPPAVEEAQPEPVVETECDKHMAVYKEQLYAQKETEQARDIAEKDLNEVFGYFSRGKNAEIMKEKEEKLKAISVNIEITMAQIKEDCEASVDEYIEQLKISLNQMFSDKSEASAQAH